MPTEAKLGVVLGLGLLIFSAVTVARPGTTVGGGPVRPVNTASNPVGYNEPSPQRLTLR